MLTLVCKTQTINYKWSPNFSRMSLVFLIDNYISSTSNDDALLGPTESNHASELDIYYHISVPCCYYFRVNNPSNQDVIFRYLIPFRGNKHVVLC